MPASRSCLLLGPRQTGKSTLVRAGVRVVFVDEIQRVHALLQEIHGLIEAHRIRFLLTGSSARKLRRGSANLLAGRAATRRLHP